MISLLFPTKDAAARFAIGFVFGWILAFITAFVLLEVQRSSAPRIPSAKSEAEVYHHRWREAQVALTEARAAAQEGVFKAQAAAQDRIRAAGLFPQNEDALAPVRLFRLNHEGNIVVVCGDGLITINMMTGDVTTTPGLKLSEASEYFWRRIAFPLPERSTTP